MQIYLAHGRDAEINGPIGTAVCRYCNTDELTWARVRVNRYRKSRLINYEERKVHTCENYSINRGSSTPIDSPEPISAPEPQKSNLSAESIVQGITERLQDAAIASAKETAERIARETANAIAAGHVENVHEVVKSTATEAADEIFVQAEARAREAAEATVREMVPQTHEIKITQNSEVIKTISGNPHKDFSLLLQIASAREHVFMIGPAGGGKTSSASMVAEALGLNYYESAMGPATSQWDLIGFRSPDGKYIPGLLREPFENGGVVMLDEIDNSNPNVLTTLNSLLANGHYNFPDGRIEKHPDFIVIAAGNTFGRGADRLYVGRNQLDAATLDRFANLIWDYDEEAEKDWAGRDKLAWTHKVQRARKIAFDSGMRVVISPRASIKGANLLRHGLEESTVEEIVLWKGMNVDDRARIERQM